MHPETRETGGGRAYDAAMIAVLGIGGVGGVLAARTGALCVGTERTVAALHSGGLRFTCAGETTVHLLEAVAELDRQVDVLVVCVKAPALATAIERVPAELVADAVVVPLLNGLEHPARLRERLPDALVVAATIGRIEAHAPRPGVVVQEGSADPVLTVASDGLAADDLRARLAELAVPGLVLEVGRSEAEVLWTKAARMAVMSSATAASAATLGEVLASPEWGDLVARALEETTAAARAHGVALEARELLAYARALPPEMTTSLARDVAAGRASELDAITGSVARAAREVGVATPALDELHARVQARSAAVVAA